MFMILDDIEEEHAGEEDDKEMKNRIENMRIYVDMCGLQQISDFEQLKPSRHILKYILDTHKNEDMKDVKFGMKIRITARSVFERQVCESVLIQQDSSKRNILLINSRSEYTRFTLPRLTTKLGDSVFEEWKKATEREKGRENDS